MARIIVVTSGKGGVGKTTTSAAISMGLALRGHRTVVIDHDHVIGEHGHAAAADRLLPAHEGEAGDRGRGRGALAPDRQAGAQHARDVAHHAVGDQPGAKVQRFEPAA